MPTLLKTIKAIQASLIHKLADYYNQPEWIDISEDSLLLNRLLAEKRSYLKSGQSIVFDVLREMPFDDSISGTMLMSEKEERVRTQFDKCLRDARQSVQCSMRKLSKLGDELQERVNVILEQTESIANSYVKEG